jgi:hypothetical protein
MSAETFYEEPQLLDTLVSFDEDMSTGELIIKREQEIPDWWLTWPSSKQASSNKTGDFLTSPQCRWRSSMTSVQLRLRRHDRTRALRRSTMLRKYALEKFILTNKRFKTDR